VRIKHDDDDDEDVMKQKTKTSLIRGLEGEEWDHCLAIATTQCLTFRGGLMATEAE
jgi:hypothetical protein